MNSRSIKRLEQAHPLLHKLMVSAAEDSPVQFEIGETLRTLAQQQKNVAAGVSWTMDSRHLPHPGDGFAYAVDVVCYANGKVSWAWPLYTKLAAHIKQRALELGIHIVWGGDWKRSKDGPHYELSRQSYP